MHRTGKNARKPADRTELGAMLRGHLRGRGNRVSVSPICAYRLALVCLPVVLVLSLVVPAAFAETEATGPPQAHIQLQRVGAAFELRATRVELISYVTPNGSPTTWRLEIATSPSVLAEGKGTLLQSGTADPGKVETSINIYQHLTPSATYYARILAKNTSGEVDETNIEMVDQGSAGSFTTLPISAPEITESFESETAENSNAPEGRCGPISPRATAAECIAPIQTNGAETKYSFEYATAKGGPYSPFASGANGTITVAEDFAKPHAGLTGLTPETTYYVRVKATNAKGTATETVQFASGSARPDVEREEGQPQISNVGAVSARLSAEFIPEDLETEYRLEYTAEPNNAGSWAAVSGGTGTIPAAEATEERRHVSVELTGLSASTTYYVRLFLKNAAGEGVFCRGSGRFSSDIHCEPIVSTASHGIASFRTTGPPAATTFAVHAFAPGGETLRALGTVSPNGTALDEEQAIVFGGGSTGGTFTLEFDGETTAPILFDPTHEVNEYSEGGRIAAALAALPKVGENNVRVSEDFLSRTYTVDFTGSLAGLDLPQIAANGLGLTPSGTVTVATIQNGAPFTIGYRVQYVDSESFEKEDGFASGHTITGPEVNLDIDADETITVGQDLSQAQPGRSYHYRLLATNSTPGDPVVEGSEQVLTVPPAPAPVEESSCPNEALRIGPSAHLPDCRAYEQVTPVNKEGSTDNWGYSGNLSTPVSIGEDGNHVFVRPQFSKWGSDADAANSSYVLSREEGKAWQMVSVTPQPQAGVNSYRPELFSPDLTQIGLSVGWSATLINASPDLDFETGAPGGPYFSVASISRKELGGAFDGWAAATADFSKVILKTEDRALVPGHTSKTISGDDLYEYTEGRLRQLNVLGGSPGSEISSCGAVMANGSAEEPGNVPGKVSSPHAISADGSRVFFTDNCTHDLYMRIDGAQTVEIGEYNFLAANEEGSKALLEKRSGGSYEIFLYETGSATVRLLLSLAHAASGLQVSNDFSTIYFGSRESLTPGAPVPSAQSEDASNWGDLPSEDLYRYDIVAHSLHFTGVQFSPVGGDQVSSDGRYLSFFSPAVAAVFSVPAVAGDAQLYRYDSVENLIECVSCASPFNPKPQSQATDFGTFTLEKTPNALPEPSYASANGDYMFFDTTSPLVPQDVDGEVNPCTEGDAEGEGCGKGAVLGNHDGIYTISSDVYEWRGSDVDGCAHAQGCLALISSGTGGLRNALIGTADEGRDVFFETHSQLAPSDTDGQGDIYDARIDGGFSPPPRPPIECEGDSCSTPFAAPSDLTPSSSTFQGAGNPLAAALPEVKPKPKSKKIKAKKKRQKKAKQKRQKAKPKTKKTGKAKKSDHRGER